MDLVAARPQRRDDITRQDLVAPDNVGGIEVTDKGNFQRVVIGHWSLFMIH
jgi:hypothetical protein